MIADGITPSVNRRKYDVNYLQLDGYKLSDGAISFMCLTMTQSLQAVINIYKYTKQLHVMSTAT